MRTDFQLIHDFVEVSNSTNSNTDKINVLKEYSQYESVGMHCTTHIIHIFNMV